MRNIDWSSVNWGDWSNKQLADLYGLSDTVQVWRQRNMYAPETQKRNRTSNKSPGPVRARDWTQVDWGKRDAHIAREIGVTREAVRKHRPGGSYKYGIPKVS